MPKNKGLNERLLEEVQNGEVGELQAQIQALKEEAGRKKQAVERFREQIRDKQTEASKLREEAERCLGRGEDPMPLLDQAVQIEHQVEGMKELLPSGEAKPDSNEQKEIQELQKRLDSVLTKAITGSQVGSEIEAEFERKLQELQRLTEEWSRAQEAVGRAYNSRARGNALKVHDVQLQKFSRETLGNVRGPRV